MSACVSFCICVFQRIGPFHVGWQIWGHRVVHGIFYIFLKLRTLTDVPIFISFISNCTFPPFFLVSLVRDLSILSILSKNQLLHWSISSWFSLFKFIVFYSNFHYFLWFSYFGLNLLLFSQFPKVDA